MTYMEYEVAPDRLDELERAEVRLVLQLIIVVGVMHTFRTDQSMTGVNNVLAR